jgi:hypothetical protein
MNLQEVYKIFDIWVNSELEKLLDHIRRAGNCCNVQHRSTILKEENEKNHFDSIRRGNSNRMILTENGNDWDRWIFLVGMRRGERVFI